MELWKPRRALKTALACTTRLWPAPDSPAPLHTRRPLTTRGHRKRPLFNGFISGFDASQSVSSPNSFSTLPNRLYTLGS
jgi:hypothetical protein